MSANPDVEVSPERPCRRCGGALLLAVQVPVPVENARGQSVTSYRTATLCPRCDRDNRAAQGVLAFFTVHETITPETVEQAIPLLQEWVENLIQHPPVYTEQELEEDIDRWERGEM